MPENLSSALAALSAPVTKLIDVVAAGCGEVWRPYQVRRMAVASADAERIQQLRAQETQALLDRQRYEHELWQLENRARITEAAAKLLPSAVTSAPVSQDWARRFFSLCQDVSSDDLQTVWSKILAGEVTKPGSFSLRTLSIVHDLTVEEANVFNTICLQSFEFEGSAYPLTFQNLRPTRMLEHQGDRIEEGDESNIGYAMYQDLEAAGLIHFEPSMIYSRGAYVHASMRSRFFLAEFSQGQLNTDPAPKRLPLGLVRLSRSGVELMPLAQGSHCPAPDINWPQLREEYGWFIMLHSSSGDPVPRNQTAGANDQVPF